MVSCFGVSLGERGPREVEGWFRTRGEAEAHFNLSSLHRVGMVESVLDSLSLTQWVDIR